MQDLDCEVAPSSSGVHLIECHDQPFDIILIVKEVRRRPKTLRLLRDDYAALQKVTNNFIRLVSLDERFR